MTGDTPVLAIMGHPNAGKSSVVATLTENDRIEIDKRARLYIRKLGIRHHQPGQMVEPDDPAPAQRAHYGQRRRLRRGGPD